MKSSKTPYNHVIVIPGLGDEISKHVWATKSWNKFNVIPHVFDTKWKDKESLNKKIDRAIELIDSLISQRARISLMGNSAGSSLALNLFCKRKNNISHIILNCGRIRRGDWPWLTFDQAAASSPSFKESVLAAEKCEKSFSNSDRKKILTLRPLFDEIVPSNTVPIKGARNEVVWSIEHVLSIGLNMTIEKERIINFIRS